MDVLLYSIKKCTVVCKIFLNITYFFLHLHFYIIDSLTSAHSIYNELFVKRKKPNSSVTLYNKFVVCQSFWPRFTSVSV